jgi:hypothetical protein
LLSVSTGYAKNDKNNKGFGNFKTFTSFSDFSNWTNTESYEGDRHSNRRGRGHYRHWGKGYGHHKDRHSHD